MNQRWLIGLAALATALLASALLTSVTSQASGGAGTQPKGTITVNSRGNDDDGKCGGPPNNNVGDTCTLREAINDANAGLADVIAFHPGGPFPTTNQGVIYIATPGFDGCLPPITRSGITIDIADAHVFIDGSVNDASPIICEAAIVVNSSETGFDFAIVGANNLTIRNFDGHGVAINCGPPENPHYLGDVSIIGVTFENLTGEDISIFCPVPTPTLPPPQLGDVNCDGHGDSLDAALILQFGAGLISSLSCSLGGDVNDDGRTNSLDAALILQYTAGLIGEF